MSAPVNKDFDGKIDGSGFKQAFVAGDKIPVDLVAPQFIEGVGRVLAYGAKKYARGQWMRGMSWSGILAAILRHTFAILRGEDRDSETGELHLYHIGCEIMFLAWFQDGPRKAEYDKFDDRLYKPAKSEQG